MEKSDEVSLQEVIKTLFAPSSLVEIAIEAYLIIGLGVMLFIAVRGMRWRRPPTGGLLWALKDHARNSLFLFQSVALLSPLVAIIWIVFWPLLLLYLWAYQQNDKDERI